MTEFNPELMAEILITRQSEFNKSNMLRSILGSGLVTSEGELWRSERRLILQAFHRACLPEYSRVAIRRTERMLAEWRPSETRNVYRDMTALTVGVAAEAFFGAELGAQKDVLHDALQITFEALIVMASQAFLVPTWVPTPSNLHFLAWTCYLVGQHPDVQARMAAEARGLLAGEIPSFEDLPRLSYTER